MGADNTDTVEIDRLRETVEKLKESLINQSETLNQYEELPATPSKEQSFAKETTSQPAPAVAPKSNEVIPEQPQNEMTEVDKQRTVIQDYDSKIQELQSSLPSLSQQIKQLREGQTKAPSYYSEYQEKIDALTKQMDTITENTVQLTREKNASQTKLDKILQFVNERDSIKKTDPVLAQDFDKEIKSFKADISPKEDERFLQSATPPPVAEKKEPAKVEPKITETKQQDLKTETKKIEPQKTEQPKFILTGGEYGEQAKQTNLMTGEVTPVPRAQPVLNTPKITPAQAAISIQPPAPTKTPSLPESKKQTKVEPPTTTDSKKASASPQIASTIKPTTEQPKEKASIEPQKFTFPPISEIKPQESTLPPTFETTSELPTGEKFAQVEATQDGTSAEILANTEKTNTTLEGLTQMMAALIQVTAAQGGKTAQTIPMPVPTGSSNTQPGTTDAELASNRGIIPDIRSKFTYTV